MKKPFLLLATPRIALDGVPHRIELRAKNLADAVGGAVRALEGVWHGGEVDLHWRAPSGEEFFWCAIDVSDVQQARFDHSNTPWVPTGSGNGWVVRAGFSMKLMPDYGGAALWTPGGSCTRFDDEDFLSGSQYCSHNEAFVHDVNTWQANFEMFSDIDGKGRPPFDWASFESLAASLALRSRGVLVHPLHVESPWERRGSSSHHHIDSLWLPSWGVETDLNRVANKALENLDEQGFVSAWKDGARQIQGCAMPWEVYAAHMGLSQAFDAMVDDCPELASTQCSWGCSVFAAAMLGHHGQIAKRVAELAPWGEASPGETWAQSVFRRAPLDDLESGSELMEILAQAGEPMPDSAWIAGLPGSRRVSLLLAKMEAIELGSVAVAGVERRPSKAL